VTTGGTQARRTRWTSPRQGEPEDAYVARVQARTIRVLTVSQAIAAVGALAGMTAGGLLASSVAADPAAAGYAQSVQTAGAAVLALPIVLIMQRAGRRRGMVAGCATALAGAGVAVVAGQMRSLPVLMVGLVLYGASAATNLQARYAAADLAPPAQRARALARVMWAVTAGVAIGPNLVAPTARLAEAVGLPPLTGAYLFAAATFAVSATVVATCLRPDPLLLARRRASGPAAALGTSAAQALRAIRSSPQARVALATMVVSHSVMLPMMVITPVHMAASGTGLTAIGAAASGHVLCMYALTPVFGRICDRYGRQAGLLIGSLLLLLAVATLGSAHHHTPRLAAGLSLLGLGWSACVVSSSVLIGESVPDAHRVRAQGLADMATGLCAAVAGLVAGPVLGAFGYPTLAGADGLLVIGLIGLHLGHRHGARAG
jgi:MFS family permease